MRHHVQEIGIKSRKATRPTLGFLSLLINKGRVCQWNQITEDLITINFSLLISSIE